MNRRQFLKRASVVPLAAVVAVPAAKALANMGAGVNDEIVVPRWSRIGDGKETVFPYGRSPAATAQSSLDSQFLRAYQNELAKALARKEDAIIINDLMERMK